jgi:hypothetical protein
MERYVPLPLYFRGTQLPVPSGYETGWAPEPVSTVTKYTFLPLPGIEYIPWRSLVITLLHLKIVVAKMKIFFCPVD